jgi:hypothetical protein
MVTGRGNRTTGTELVSKFDASGKAKEKFAAIIETVSGEKKVGEVCDELGIGEAMFYKMRDRFFAECLPLLEPRAAGRKPAEKPDTQVAGLKAKIEELNKRLIGTECQRDLALLGLEISDFNNEPSSKKKSAAERRKKKRLRKQKRATRRKK